MNTDASGEAVHDPARLAELRRLVSCRGEVLQEALDRVVALASAVLDAPVALISLVEDDRQVFVAQFGLPEPLASAPTAPISYSFCRHAVNHAQPLVVDDAGRHPLGEDNPLVSEHGVTAYAGIPLVTRRGHVLGTLCVIDDVPRTWTPWEVDVLADLTTSAVREIDRHLCTADEEGRAEADPPQSASARVLPLDPVRRGTRQHPVRGRPLVSGADADAPVIERVAGAQAASEDGFWELASRIGDVFWILDVRTGRVFHVSAAYHRTWEVSDAEILPAGDDLLHTVAADDLPSLLVGMERLRRDGAVGVECRVRDDEGAPLWVLARGFHGAEVGATCAAARVARDGSDAGAGPPPLFWISDPRMTEWLYVGSGCERICGRSAETLYAEPATFLHAVHPEDMERFQSSADRLAGGERVEVDYRVVHPDGSVRHLHSRGIPVLDETGAVSRVAGLTREVGEAEESVPGWPADLESHPGIEAAAHMVTVLNAARRVLYQSPAVSPVLGHAPEEWVGRPLLRFVHRDDRGTLAERLERVEQLRRDPERRIRVRVRFRSGNGEWRVIEVTAVNRLSEPGVHGLVLVSRDVTGQWARSVAQGRGGERLRLMLGQEQALPV
jgi:PAS domain S-box-containing protein